VLPHIPRDHEHFVDDGGGPSFAGSFGVMLEKKLPLLCYPFVGPFAMYEVMPSNLVLIPQNFIHVWIVLVNDRRFGVGVIALDYV